ncbi:alpha/beta fold hydrolase [Novosphingobium sp. 1949]|uniref:Alpha/beta fold hydrolase n=2 Tax=Novosphingobium organovorum TaxID=2930092 RepID=A0ABT0B9A7_9SPHN|nr:alpha/beta fold hydrolase [Novosphingobium organovorum]
MTGGLSPATMMLAATDWAIHLATAPGKQMQLAAKAMGKSMRLFDYALRASHELGGPTGTAEPACPVVAPLAQDHRFDAPEWHQAPYNVMTQAFLLNQQWWQAATTGIGGVSRHHEDMVSFAARQILDVMAPTNFIATNPVLQKRIAETGGKCLADGLGFFLDDLRRELTGAAPAGTERFVVGENIATAKGTVVYRNRLIELIQYAPRTETVRPEPVLIVPAWIMKYYILDLSATNSLVNWLTGQGYTVFMISWHNPSGEDRELTLDDYRRMGPMAALDAVEAITGAEKIHAAGYCLGGTLLSITAAAMAGEGDTRLASVTLLAAQTEFSEPGELGLFIDESQLHVLENMMWSRGYLESGQMGGAFQILRSNDLIWSHVLETYLMGERAPINDLMAWNADGTRMPFAMHSEYLRALFLHDDLAEGRFRVDGRVISLEALRAPMFVVGTERDHVAPWHSVYKIHLLSSAEVTFVLTSGGHNAGIVSEPGHPRRHFRIATRAEDAPPIAAEEWVERATPMGGSWWTQWGAWLDARSGEPVPPPMIGNAARGYPPLCPAPGRYVLEK